MHPVAPARVGLSVARRQAGAPKRDGQGRPHRTAKGSPLVRAAQQALPRIILAPLLAARVGQIRLRHLTHVDGRGRRRLSPQHRLGARANALTAPAARTPPLVRRDRLRPEARKGGAGGREQSVLLSRWPSAGAHPHTVNMCGSQVRPPRRRRVAGGHVARDTRLWICARLRAAKRRPQAERQEMCPAVRRQSRARQGVGGKANLARAA
eukprot:scaffold6116_cov104-Isochrysis_galbana.AAC.2